MQSGGEFKAYHPTDDVVQSCAIIYVNNQQGKTRRHPKSPVNIVALSTSYFKEDMPSSRPSVLITFHPNKY